MKSFFTPPPIDPVKVAIENIALRCICMNHEVRGHSDTRLGEQYVEWFFVAPPPAPTHKSVCVAAQDRVMAALEWEILIPIPPNVLVLIK